MMGFRLTVLNQRTLTNFDFLEIFSCLESVRPKKIHLGSFVNCLNWQYGEPEWQTLKVLTNSLKDLLELSNTSKNQALYDCEFFSIELEAMRRNRNLIFLNTSVPSSNIYLERLSHYLRSLSEVKKEHFVEYLDLNLTKFEKKSQHPNFLLKEKSGKFIDFNPVKLSLKTLRESFSSFARTLWLEDLLVPSWSAYCLKNSQGSLSIDRKMHIQTKKTKIESYTSLIELDKFIDELILQNSYVSVELICPNLTVYIYLLLNLARKGIECLSNDQLLLGYLERPLLLERSEKTVVIDLRNFPLIETTSYFYT